MKKILLLTVLSVFSVNSFAQSSFTCSEIYQRIMVAKDIKKKKVGDINDRVVGPVAVVTFLGAPMVGIPMLAVAAGMNFYAGTDSREERALELMSEGSLQIERLTKGLQKKVSSDITSDEVIAIIREGLDSGEYCKDFPKLADRKDIKDHVTEVLKLKYAVGQ